MSDARSPARGGAGRAALVIGGLLGLAALLFAWRTGAVIDNAILYCLEARRGTGLFHPHHILYNAAIHWTARGLAAIGIGADTIAAAQAHNALFAAALVGAFAVWLARVREARRFGAVEVVAPLLLVGTSTFLEFATQPESYVPSLACAVGALAVLVDGPGRVRAGRVVLAGVLLALAVLYHQICVVFSVLLLVQAAAADGARRRPALREALAAIVVAGGLSLGAYLLAYSAAEVEASFFEYCTYYAHMGHQWGVVGNLDVNGLAQLGSMLAVAVAGPRAAGAGSAALVAVALLLAANVVAALRGAASRELRLIALAWAGGLLGFLLWWLPSEVNYAIFAMPPLAVLAGLSIRDACGERAARPIAIGAATAMLAAAFAREVLPNHRNPNPVRVRAAALHAIGEPGAVRICDLPTTYYLFYDFDERSVLHVGVAMAAALGPGAGRARPQDPLRGAPAIAIPLAELRPDLIAERLAAQAPGNPSQPWLDFAAWLFDLRVDDGQGTRRDFALRRMSNGELALELWNRRVPCADMDALLQSLDREVAAQSGDEIGFSFAAWARSAAR